MRKITNKCKKLLFFVFMITVLATTLSLCVKNTEVYATDISDDNKEDDKGFHIGGNIGDIDFSFGTDTPEGDRNNGLSATLRILIILTVISLAPSILIMVTSFMRILIVLHFVRASMGMQTTPPNQVLIGLAIFLTFFVMEPVFSQVNTVAIQPLERNEITYQQAFDLGIEPVREFMFSQIRNESDLALFCNMAGIETVDTLKDIPTYVLIPAFIISELRIAFYIGFIIYIPFIVIDMVVSSTLMSMGMMMLPPTTISTPFKILLFVVADGWTLVIEQLVMTFY